MYSCRDKPNRNDAFETGVCVYFFCSAIEQDNLFRAHCESRVLSVSSTKSGQNRRIKLRYIGFGFACTINSVFDVSSMRSSFARVLALRCLFFDVISLKWPQSEVPWDVCFYSAARASARLQINMIMTCGHLWALKRVLNV